jgi:hypothetical protein
MSTADTHPMRRIGAALLAAVGCGALAGNLIAGEALDLSDGWRNGIWIVAAFVGGTLTWSAVDDDPASEAWSRRDLLIVVATIAIAISLTVLGGQAGFYAGLGVLAIGAVAFLVDRRQRRDSGKPVQ